MTALAACVTALITMALNALHSCQSCAGLKYHPSGACLLDHNDCHNVSVNKLMQFTDTSWLLMAMHIIMDNGAGVIGPTQGLLTLDSYPSLQNTILYKTWIAANMPNNYPVHNGILRFSTILQQLITSPYLNQTTAANVLNQYSALYENLGFNIISQ